MAGLEVTPTEVAPTAVTEAAAVITAAVISTAVISAAVGPCSASVATLIRVLVGTPVRALFELGPQTVLHRRAVCDQCRQFNAVYTQVLAGGEPFTEQLAPSTPLPDDGTFTYEARCRTCFVRPA